MKQLVLVFLSLVFFTALHAHGEAENNPVTDALKQQVQALNDAMIDADRQSLQALTSKELSYGHSSGRVENQQQFIANLENGSSDFVSIELEDQTIATVDNIGIVRHVLSAKTNDSGKPGKVRIGVMLVWQKSDGNWQLLARQAFKL